MHKKQFIALADAIREHNKYNDGEQFTTNQLTALAAFCLRQNHGFNMIRWLDYIAGKCGPNGGAK